MRHTRELRILLPIVSGVLALSSVAAAQTSGRGSTNPNNKVYEASGFRLEYPKRNWTPSGVGVGSAIVVFSEKSGEATVAVERIRIEHPLAQDEINDQTAKLEVEDWQARRPFATAPKPQIVQIGGGRVIVSDFTQPGSRGAEHVRMYTLPRGSDWYRVICTTTQASFDKYKDTCQSLAVSLTPTSSK
jgi:hypothetical protein